MSEDVDPYAGGHPGTVPSGSSADPLTGPLPASAEGVGDGAGVASGHEPAGPSGSGAPDPAAGHGAAPPVVAERPGAGAAEQLAGANGEPSGGTYREPIGRTYGEPAAGTYGDPVPGTYGEPVAATYGEPAAGTHGEPAAGTHGEPASGATEEPHSGAAPGPAAGPTDAAAAGPAAAATDEAAVGAAAGAAAGTAAAPASASASAPAARQRRGSFMRELPFLILIALVLALLIKAFVLQAFFIPSGSMENTLRIGDRVLVNKLVYRVRSVHRGEIIVFKGPPSWAAEVTVATPTNPVSRFFRDIGSALGFAPPGERDFIKRVVGIPGDTVACCTNGEVTVNGVALTEPYLYPGSTEQPFQPVKVPAGRLWVMGDHRVASADSRAHIGEQYDGTIPEKNVIGRAFLVVWPPSHVKTLPVPHTFARALATAGSVGAPYAAGLLGALPLTMLRRRRRMRRPRR